jgi:CheY-like chemotaxis protein
VTTTKGVLDAGRYVVIRVRDTGEGIAPEAMERLFEPFFTTRPPRHAPGLGLSIAYGVISQAGGSMSLESELGKGTCVSLYLPRAKSSTTDKISRQTVIAGARILLAEDEPQVRQMTARILRHAGFTVIEAADGVEALAVLEREAGELGLLVTDVIMPNMGGAELARHAQPLDAALPVIFVSGYTAQGLSEHGALREGCELVHKPFSAELLLEKVREHTRGVAAKPPQADGEQ